MQACRFYRMELGRRAVGVQDVEMFASRALEARCRRADVEMFASRTLEACCGPWGVVASRDLELGRHAAGMGTWRHVEV